MNEARAKAVRMLTTMRKSAEQPDEGKRQIGQRTFEGGMKGVGTGGVLGMLLGALGGGYAGYKGSEGGAGSERLKKILLGALTGAGTGGVAGAGIGGAVGGLGGAALGSRKQQPTY